MDDSPKELLALPAPKPETLEEEAPKNEAESPVQTRTDARNTGRRGEQLTKSLQEQAFILNVVEGRSCREIAQILSIDKSTASKYIRAETDRRAEEISAERERLKAESVAFYDEMAALGVELARKSGDAFMQPLIRGLDSALKARERRDKILGLDAPTKIDVGLRDLLQAFNDSTPDSGADKVVPE